MIKDFKKIVVAFFLSEFGRAMYFVSITWLLYQLTNDPIYTGLLVSLGFLPGLVMNVFFGVVVDRFDRKKLSVLANLLSTTAMLSLLICFLFGVIEPWLIMGVHMVLQMSGSLFRPAIQAFMAERFPKEQLPKVFSQSSSAAIIGGLLGASLGGLIISMISISGSMAIVTGSFAIASITLLLIRNAAKERAEAVVKKSIATDIVEGFTYLKRNRFLLGLFVIMFNGQLVFHTSLGFLSVYTIDYLQQTAAVYGLLDATISVGGVIAAEYGANYIYLSLMLPISLCVLFAIFQSRQKSFIQMTKQAA
ncbi:MFS transporter [Alkalihalophilus sp. As8PL]|uniref:MFS transporter n=1 Tax=Alkalihalophilus sp. As8PL TaxID=3237103 RepID=A0AB39BWI4_9BACI